MAQAVATTNAGERLRDFSWCAGDACNRICNSFCFSQDSISPAAYALLTFRSTVRRPGERPGDARTAPTGHWRACMKMPSGNVGESSRVVARAPVSQSPSVGVARRARPTVSAVTIWGLALACSVASVAYLATGPAQVAAGPRTAAESVVAAAATIHASNARHASIGQRPAHAERLSNTEPSIEAATAAPCWAGWQYGGVC